MIEEKKVHSAKCNRCKKPYELLCGHSFFSQIGELIDHLSESSWVNENGELHCRECRMIDEQMSPLAYLKIKHLEVEYKELIVHFIENVNKYCAGHVMPKEKEVDLMAAQSKEMLTILK
jgi:hypothetical protein